MSNETCVVTIADIYGAEWWDRNKEELERDWEWSFGVPTSTDSVTPNYCYGIVPQNTDTVRSPRIILHRRKPKPPTLRDVYGVDEVAIPGGWEWTGEWRPCGRLERHLSRGGYVHELSTIDPRLILRERTKKVWFKAEERARIANYNDWIWDVSMEKWVRLEYGGGFHLCATRHEEIDQTIQVVTQAMVDEAVQV